MSTTIETHEKLAQSLAKEYCKDELKITSNDDGSKSYEVCGFEIYQDLNDPVMSCRTIAKTETPLPGRFKFVVMEPYSIPATYWEPEDVDVYEVERTDTLIQAVEFVAKRLLDQSMRDFLESTYLEQVEVEQ